MNVVPDTSVVIDGRLSERVSPESPDETEDDVDLTGVHIYVPEAVVGELESQANAGRSVGWRGIENYSGRNYECRSGHERGHRWPPVRAC